MVLEDLGRNLTSALQSLGAKTIVDEETFKEFMNQISRALMSSDVNIRLVKTLTDNIKTKVKLQDTAAGINKRKLIEKAVFEELCRMLDCGISPEKNPSRIKKGEKRIVMFVGLQGAGKTTTIMKYAHYYKSKGLKPAMVCADTFRAGAFDQLKQNATKIQVPFYGDYEATDPARIAKDGVAIFEKEGRDLILVDTSGRHKQQEALFEEMKAVASAVQPDLVVFVMDGSIGQAAQDQAQAFRSSVDVGGVILTKMDGHAKGGGALSAVAATSSPILFIGTGEHMDQFEPFDAQSFVGKLLNIGDVKGLMDKINEIMPEDKQPEMMEKLLESQFTLRAMREQYENVMRLGPMSQVMGLIPGMSGMSGMVSDQASTARLKKFMTIMDSMTHKELDCPDVKVLMAESRIKRIARGSGSHPQMIVDLLEEFKKMGGVLKQFKDLKLHKKGGDMNPRQMQQLGGKMSNILPPQMMQQLGGAGGLSNIMKQLQSMDPKSMASMAKMAGKMGLKM